jgi:hypothetical protein
VVAGASQVQDFTVDTFNTDPPGTLAGRFHIAGFPSDAFCYATIFRANTDFGSFLDCTGGQFQATITREGQGDYEMPNLTAGDSWGVTDVEIHAAVGNDFYFYQFAHNYQYPYINPFVIQPGQVTTRDFILDSPAVLTGDAGDFSGWRLGKNDNLQLAAFAITADTAVSSTQISRTGNPGAPVGATLFLDPALDWTLNLQASGYFNHGDGTSASLSVALPTRELTDLQSGSALLPGMDKLDIVLAKWRVTDLPLPPPDAIFPSFSWSAPETVDEPPDGASTRARSPTRAASSRPTWRRRVTTGPTRRSGSTPSSTSTTCRCPSASWSTPTTSWCSTPRDRWSPSGCPARARPALPAPTGGWRCRPCSPTPRGCGASRSAASA